MFFNDRDAEIVSQKRSHARLGERTGVLSEEDTSVSCRASPRGACILSIWPDVVLLLLLGHVQTKAADQLPTIS